MPTDLILVKAMDSSLVIRPVEGLLNDANCQLPTVRDLSRLGGIVNINKLQVVEACCVGRHAGEVAELLRSYFSLVKFGPESFVFGTHWRREIQNFHFTCILLWKNCSLKSIVEGIQYYEEEERRVAPLLEWLSQDDLQIERTDLQVGHLPEYLKSPLRLHLEYALPISSVIKITSPLEPKEIYAYCRAREQHQKMYNVIIIEPAFTELFLKYEAKRLETTQPSQPPSQLIAKRPVDSQASLADTSISLGDWTPSQDLPCPVTDIKVINKGTLKKLMLLSLRHVGVDKHHREFASIWKHLYCGCLFALRKDLSSVRIGQQEMLVVIRSNMNFLNIK